MCDDLILCQITSRKIKRDDFSIPVSKDETLNGTLSLNSYIRTNMIFTASKSQIFSKICNIDNKKYDQVVSKIIRIISK